jgi:hypothetical protein
MLFPLLFFFLWTCFSAVSASTQDSTSLPTIMSNGTNIVPVEPGVLSDQTGDNTAIIIGGSCGGIVGLGVIIFVIMSWRRSQRAQESSEKRAAFWNQRRASKGGQLQISKTIIERRNDIDYDIEMAGNEQPQNDTESPYIVSDKLGLGPPPRAPKPTKYSRTKAPAQISVASPTKEPVKSNTSSANPLHAENPQAWLHTQPQPPRAAAPPPPLQPSTAAAIPLAKDPSKWKTPK